MDCALRMSVCACIFQSTLSVRRATLQASSQHAVWPISIHALREESDGYRSCASATITISIHALREESDMHAVKAFRYEKFQSTLSVRRATNAKTGFSALSLFQSTLSVRRATQTMVNKNNLLTISIHALREESDIQTTINDTNSSTFQSTLSVRRATLHLVQHLQSASISIHALREESDQGEERFHPESEISIHALREESDRTHPPNFPRPNHFNPRSP